MGSFLRENFLPVILAIAGIALLAFGAFQITSNQKKNTVEFQTTASAEKPTASKIAVDIEGAVIKPGVYQLTDTDRFVDALAAAGGLSDEADRDWVEKNINLAKKVSDGLKIYIPRTGEEILSASDGGAGGVSSTININTASTTDLDTLPGIGPVTAQKIINGRPYATVQDLISHKIVSQSVFDKIKDMISAN